MPVQHDLVARMQKSLLADDVHAALTQAVQQLHRVGSGQTEGVYQPSAALSRVGVAAIASLALWVAGYFAIGIAVVNG